MYFTRLLLVKVFVVTFDSLIAESIFPKRQQSAFTLKLGNKNFEHEIGTWQYGF